MTKKVHGQRGVQPAAVTGRDDKAIAARRRRLLAELVRVTLSELSPDPEHRAAAARRFEVALDEEPSQCSPPPKPHERARHGLSGAFGHADGDEPTAAEKLAMTICELAEDVNELRVRLGLLPPRSLEEMQTERAER
jgi:hypothetical protein